MRSSIAGKQRAGFVKVALVIPIAIAIASTAGILLVRNESDRHRAGRLQLAELRATLDGLAAEEAGATNLAVLAGRGTSHTVEMAVRGFAAELDRATAPSRSLLAELQAAGVEAGVYPELSSSAGRVLHVMEKQLSLLEDGRYAEAFAYHRRQIDVELGRFDRQADRADAGLVDAARRDRFLADAGTFAVVAMALIVLVLLHHRSERDRRRYERQLEHQALHDSVTGFPNRNMLAHRLGHALDRLTRASAPVAVIFMDLDGFKEVNDTLGHEAGDVLLRQVAERVAACTRESDTTARVGGDEFVLLLEDVEGLRALKHITERILDALNRPFFLGSGETRVGASLGAVLVAEPLPAAQVLAAADAAMYEAKTKGKARACVRQVAGPRVRPGTEMAHA